MIYLLIIFLILFLSLWFCSFQTAVILLLSFINLLLIFFIYSLEHIFSQAEKQYGAFQSWFLRLKSLFSSLVE